MKVVILAGGSGENLVPFTTTRPKTMLAFCGKYILETTLEHLKELGLNRVHITVCHQKKKIMEYFQNGHNFGVHLHYVHQEDPRGIGDALYAAKDKILPGEYFLLVYGDILTFANIYSQTLQTFHNSKGPVAAIYLPPYSFPYGNVYLDNEMRITKLVEKPKEGLAGNYVLAGVYVLPSTIFTLLEECNKSMELALNRLITEMGIQASTWEDEWIDIGYPWEILNANKLIMNSWTQASIDKSVNLKGDVRLEGPVRIEEEVVVESGTVLKGPCYIGPGSFVGNNVLVREYTSIGRETQIGFGVELKNCVIFSRCKVGRLSFVGDSVVGEGAYLGSGTVTVNFNLDDTPINLYLNHRFYETGITKLGAFIGDMAKIGAGHTLPAGTIINAEEITPPNYSISVGNR
jgi:UDP-N-acetylglucosamine diphosphorylase / glucose-1-phosphate thymidylyltransferase / UDP-N-acetylgalactosamine diphosphorylase / glucosamine-1-phosphate N-acetyltransferase / galactosamine-1-phosphate N-acetyltransferase